MALYVKTTKYTPMEYTHGAILAKGVPIYINSQYAFPLTVTEANKAATFVIEADCVEVACDNTLTYTSGEAVYDADPAPTGSVNKTSGAGRKKIGVVTNPEGKVYPVGTTAIQIRFIANEA